MEEHRKSLATLSRLALATRTAADVVLPFLYSHERRVGDPLALFHGIRAGNLDTVKRALAYGWRADERIAVSCQNVRDFDFVDFVHGSPSTEQGHREARTCALRLAVSFGHIHVARHLLDLGADVNENREVRRISGRQMLVSPEYELPLRHRLKTTMAEVHVPFAVE